MNKIIGWALIVMASAHAITNLMTRPENALWFSNHMFFIVGLAFLLNIRWLLVAEFCLGFLPELFWNLDFFANLLGFKLFGFTTYMFNNGFDWSNTFSLLHLLTIPMLLYGLWTLEGPIRFAWAGALVHGFSIYGLSFLTDPEFNVNCAWRSCFEFSVPYYGLVWPLVIVSVVFLSYGVVWLLNRVLSQDSTR